MIKNDYYITIIYRSSPFAFLILKSNPNIQPYKFFILKEINLIKKTKTESYFLLAEEKPHPIINNQNHPISLFKPPKNAVKNDDGIFNFFNFQIISFEFY